MIDFGWQGPRFSAIYTLSTTLVVPAFGFSPHSHTMLSLRQVFPIVVLNSLGWERKEIGDSSIVLNR